MEGMNAEFIHMGLAQSERLKRLNQIAIRQMQVLTSSNLKVLPGAKENNFIHDPARNPTEIRQIEIRTNRIVTETLAGGLPFRLQGPGHEFDEVRELSARRRRACDRLERHRANEPSVHQEVRRGARVDRSCSSWT